MALEKNYNQNLKYDRVYLANLDTVVPIWDINWSEMKVVVRIKDIPADIARRAMLGVHEYVTYWFGENAGGNRLIEAEEMKGATAQPTRKPKMGMIMCYNHPGSADMKFPPKQSPAMVQKVNEDGTLELVVFSVYGGLFFNHNVVIGEGASQCSFIE
jgi:hypothetical protein